VYKFLISISKIVEKMKSLVLSFEDQSFSFASGILYEKKKKMSRRKKVKCKQRKLQTDSNGKGKLLCLKV
jgi:hypothetical protein